MTVKIILKQIKLDDPQLPEVIKFSIGEPNNDKTIEVIKSYRDPDQSLIGAFMGDILIGVIGLSQKIAQITIRHISVLPKFQRQRVGSLLLDYAKGRYVDKTIVATTDEDSVKFYLKSGFKCNSFQRKYGNLRYSCQFNQK